VVTPDIRRLAMKPIKKENARRALGIQALGIAEDHTRPGGRVLAMNLITEGLVTKLFVEYAEEFGYNALCLAQRKHEAGGTIAEVAKLAPNSTHPNPLPLSLVIATAIGYDVPVILADDQCMNERTQAKYFDKRHRKIKAKFLPQRLPEANDSAGFLFLFGANHFTNSEHPLDSYIECHVSGIPNPLKWVWCCPDECPV
jgi:hypothetical protein